MQQFCRIVKTLTAAKDTQSLILITPKYWFLGTFLTVSVGFL